MLNVNRSTRDERCRREKRTIRLCHFATVESVTTNRIPVTPPYSLAVPVARSGVASGCWAHPFMMRCIPGLYRFRISLLYRSLIGSSGCDTFELANFSGKRWIYRAKLKLQSWNRWNENTFGHFLWLIDPGEIGLRDRAVTVRASISNSRTSHQHHRSRRTICAFSFYDAKPF
jgi:hypothetical protein